MARTNVYNREQGESGVEEMKREGERGERRSVGVCVCAFGVCYKIVYRYTVIHTQRHVEPRFL